MRVLLLSNPSQDLGSVEFRAPSYEFNLLPMARALNRTGEADARVLMSPEVFTALRQKDHLAPDLARIGWKLDTSDLLVRGWGNILGRSYREDVPEDVFSAFRSAVEDPLGDWTPDVVLAWETPSKLLRRIFPDALFLDLTPSPFMRKPYIPLVSIDTRGIFKDCWYTDLTLEDMQASDDMLAAMRAFRNRATAYFAGLSTPKRIQVSCGFNLNDSDILVPGQNAQYLAWRANTGFDDVLELARAVAVGNENARVVVTQKGRRDLNSSLSGAELERLGLSLPNLVSPDVFRSVGNVSQYILPNIGTVVSVSSSLGLQAKFFGKRLVSPSRSHLAAVADSHDIRDVATAPNRNLDGFLANYLCRTCYSRELLTDRDGYLLSLVRRFMDRKGAEGIEAFPDFSDRAQMQDPTWSGDGTFLMSTPDAPFEKHFPERKPDAPARPPSRHVLKKLKGFLGR